MPETLLSRVTALASVDDDAGIDVIYEEVDSMFRAGQFATVDAILAGIDDAAIAALPIVHSLAFLSITCVAAGYLPARPGYLGRVRKYLEVVEPDRVDALLWGF